jgi:heterodisulfide reductase subunit B
MKYQYYPGCSLTGTAREYDMAVRAVMSALEVNLLEIADWTCCGASAAAAVDRLLSLALPARNLALAEAHSDAPDVLIPCSACYLNLKQVEILIHREPQTLARLNQILADEPLTLTGRVTVRHLLDVLARDLGPEAVAERVRTPLDGWVVAPYYGCQCLRPYVIFDDPERPRSMAPLIAATGARVHAWTMGAKCCGASHMNTEPEVARRLVAAILRGARGADAIVTVCPMCQINLEAHQRKIARETGEDLSVAVLYLPQLLGLALGIAPDQLGIHLNLAVGPRLRAKFPGPERKSAGASADARV